MNSLIVKLGATGDVVRTTALLRRLEGRVTWITARPNDQLLSGLVQEWQNLRVLTWEDRHLVHGEVFDLAISLEDDEQVAKILESVRPSRIFGANLNRDGRVIYTEDASRWFDMSLISVHGRKKADELKFRNRHSYQELIFEGLGWKFSGENYVLPETPTSDLRGDVAIAAESGAVWPMKKWAYYDALKIELERQGLRVNFLPKRPTLLSHLADIRGHRCLVGGDSLPMHLAIGSGIPSLAIFKCTSPWEIHDYGILTKLISPLLGDFFYSREFDAKATTAVSFDAVLEATLNALGRD